MMIIKEVGHSQLCNINFSRL